MDYILFLVTIQVPFLYFVWKIVQKQNSQQIRSLQMLKKQNGHIVNFMDTLRLSVEKISKDIYENGKVSSRMLQIEKDIKDLKNRFQQMEIYTGLSINNHPIENLSSSSSLKGKEFS